MLVLLQIFGADMAEIERIDRELKRLEELRKKILERKSDILRNKLIKCANCGKQNKVREWSFVQKYWYVPPHGCTGGDYWKPHEHDTCDIMCPKCASKNYIYNHPQKPKILQIIKDNPRFGTDGLFKEVIKSDNK